MQAHSNSSALAMELMQSCTKPSIYFLPRESISIIRAISVLRYDRKCKGFFLCFEVNALWPSDVIYGDIALG